jgi:hypothetical protein
MLYDLLQVDSMGLLTHGKILYNNGCHKGEDSHINFHRQKASICNKASERSGNEVYVLPHKGERSQVVTNRPKDCVVPKNLQHVLGQDADQSMAPKPPLCMVGTVSQV